jgi:hypothetical protein
MLHRYRPRRRLPGDIGQRDLVPVTTRAHRHRPWRHGEAHRRAPRGPAGPGPARCDWPGPRGPTARPRSSQLPGTCGVSSPKPNKCRELARSRPRTQQVPGSCAGSGRKSQEVARCPGHERHRFLFLTGKWTLPVPRTHRLALFSRYRGVPEGFGRLGYSDAGGSLITSRRHRSTKKSTDIAATDIAAAGVAGGVSGRRHEMPR